MCAESRRYWNKNLCYSIFMAKKIIKDILVKEKKDKLPSRPISSQLKPPPKIKPLIFLILGLAIVAILGTIGLVNFSSATVKISPYQEFINIDFQFRAVRGGGELAFEIMQFEHEDIQAVQATGISAEGRKARGEIVVYNTSSVSQKLISQTRFQAPDGKIYRIQESIVVPSNGSVETTVYADKPGPEYNIGLADFTIPGLKGSPRYEKVYGRSKTEMSGGSMGTVLFVSEDDINNTRENLKKKIEDYLKEIIFKQKPGDYLLYEKAIKMDFYDDPTNPQTGDIISDKTFVFKEKGKLTGFLIKKDDLSTALADKYIPQEKNNAKAVDLEGLEFDLLSKNSGDTEINFNLKGRLNFVWNIDTDSLIKELMNEKDYNSVFNRYPRIKKAEIIFKPFWWRFMPRKESRIHIEVVL